MTALATTAVTQSRLDIDQQIILIIALFVYLLLSFRQSARTCLYFDSRWHWCAPQDAGRPLLLEHAVVWPVLILLRFRDPDCSRLNPGAYSALTLLPDSVATEDWRRLRVFLRMVRRIG